MGAVHEQRPGRRAALISGYFSPEFARPAPMVHVAVYLPGVTWQPRYVDFVIDTGASITAVHPADA